MSHSQAGVHRGGILIRAAAITLAELLLLGGCLFGAAGQLLWPMAWPVLSDLPFQGPLSDPLSCCRSCTDRLSTWLDVSWRQPRYAGKGSGYGVRN